MRRRLVSAKGKGVRAGCHRFSLACQADREIAFPRGRNHTGIEAAVVTMVFTAAERKDVLTVPVAALVALAEGGYGVEVVDADTTHYIKVAPGLFSQGRVEVTGDGLQGGMTVGMPQ